MCLFANEKQVNVDVVKARHKAALPELIISSGRAYYLCKIK